MNKLFLACAIWVPLVGCTGVVSQDPGGFSNGTAGSSAASAGGASGSASGTSGGAQSSSPGGSNQGAGAPGTGGSGSGGLGSGTGTAGGSSSGGTTAVGGNTAAGGGASGGACSQAVLPAAVQTMLTNKCATCHGAMPLTGLPSLVSYANLTAPSTSDPSKTNAVVALARIQSTTAPMPPSPGSPVAASDISALQTFISQGYPKPSCPTGTGGAGGSGGNPGTGGTGTVGGSGGASNDPLLAKAICTSMASWTGGNRGSAAMNPGLACISCHSSGDGPSFSIAGTVYPTGHEPDRCNSSAGTQGAQIVIIGADGKMVTLTPNNVGNFSSNTAIKTPYQAKVTYQGRERLMIASQTSGDCNSCHTQNGANGAPGRITVP